MDNVSSPVTPLGEENGNPPMSGVECCPRDCQKPFSTGLPETVFWKWTSLSGVLTHDVSRPLSPTETNVFARRQ